MNHLKRFYQLAGCLLVGAGLTFTAYAAPEDDPLGTFIQQKQNDVQRPAAKPNTNDADHEGMDNLVRQRTQSRPAATPQTPSRPTPSRATQNRNEPPPASSNPKGDTDELLASAMGFLGVAYRFGGTSPTGFDCSGFMQYIFRKAFAVNLPRTSAEQATVGTPVSRSQLQPGDMVFFRTAGSRISHVGMYVGNDRFIHAPRTGKRIEITSLSNRYWSSKYATARRVKRNNAQNFIRN